MSKDAYWFRHDSTAGRAIKMRKMSHIYGHWGKGVYWDVIEILRDQKTYKFESDESSLQLLCDLIGCKDDSKFISWFNDCVRLELFKVEENMFFNEPLTENMKKWDSNKANGGKGGRPKKNPNHNPIETQTITQSKPYTEQKNTEEKKTEEESILDLMQTLNNLVNSQWLDGVAKRNGLKQPTIKKLFKEFGNLQLDNQKDYETEKELKSHFANWIRKKDLVTIKMNQPNPIK